MHKLMTWRSALFALCCLFAAQFASAQCISGPTTVCGESTHTYTIDPAQLPPGTNNTLWTVLNGAISPPTSMTATNVTWGPQGTGMVTATFLKSNGATAGVCTLQVAITPLPEITLEPAFTQECNRKDGGYNSLVEGYCEKQLVPFTATGVDNCNDCYKWVASGNAYVVSQNGPNAEIQFTGAGNAEVCVIVTTPEGCSNQLCKSYIVYANPVADFTILSHPNATTEVDICLNESLTFFGSYIDPNDLELGGYNWLVYEAANPANVIGGGTGQTFIQAFNTAGDYVVQLTVSNCLGCTDVKTILIHVNPFAGPEITCPSVVCESSQPVLYCAPLDCTNATWSVTGGTFQPNSNAPNCIDVIWSNPPASGFGTVTLSCSNALCPVPTTVEVPIIPETPQIQGPILICDNQADGNVYSLPFWPGTDYTWTVTPSNSSISGSSPSQTPNVFFVNLNGYNGDFVVNVTLNNIIADCKSEGSLTVTVRDYNINVSPSNEFCYGFPEVGPTFTVTPTPTPSGYHILWTISTTNYSTTIQGAPDDPVLTNLNFQSVFGAAGNFQVCAEIVQNGSNQTCDGLCTAITINEPVPPITGVTGRQNVCPNSTVAYVAVPAIPGSSYEWEITGGTGSGITLNPSRSVTWGPSEPYHLRVRRIVDGCKSEWFDLDITKLMVPDVDFTGTLNVCTDVPYTYTANDLNLDQYTWMANGGSIISGQGTPVVQVIWHQSNITNPFIRLTGRLCGQNNTETKFVNLVGQDAAIDGPLEICQHTNGTYSVVPADPNATYTWFVNGNPVSGSGPSIVLNFPFIGNASIRVRIENYMGCPGIVGLEYNVTVTPNPEQFISQVGFLCCTQKGTVVLTSSVPASNPNSTFTWYHFENGAWVQVQNSIYASRYIANGAVLTINYTPFSGPAMIGAFRVVINEGTDCPTEVTHTVTCLQDCSGEPCTDVRFTDWYFPSKQCGTVEVVGSVSPTCLVNAYFVVLTGTSGIGFPSQIPVADINNPSAVLTPFLEPGIYLIGLVGVYDCDGHGPKPPRYCISTRYVTIPVISDFDTNISCDPLQSGVFNVDLLNTSDYLPQFEGNIQWTWTSDGTIIGNGTNSAIQLAAGETKKICLTAKTEVNDNGVIKPYVCRVCQDISIPKNQTIDIDANLSSVCTGAVGTFGAIIGDPSQILSYNWTFTYPFGFPVFTSTVASPIFAFPLDGTYTIELEVLLANGCRLSAIRSIEIQLHGIELSTYISGAPCGAQHLNACYQSTVCQGYQYLWSTIPPATTSEVTIDQSGVYTVTVTNPANGCTLTSTFSVTASSPFPGSYYGNLSQCEGEYDLSIIVPVRSGFVYTFNGLNTSATTGGSVVLWNVPLGNVGNLPAGNYTFTITVKDNQGNNCSATMEGSVTIHPKPDPVPFTISYNCDPFSAVLVADQPVSWFNNGNFLAYSSQITVFTGGYYYTEVINEYGCSNQFGLPVSNAPSADILCGCYCIEPEIVNSGQAIIEAPNGNNYTYWEWRRGTDVLLSCSTPPSCSPIPDLTLTPDMQGDITLFVKQAYQNSDGSTVECMEESCVFCWWIGPCDSVKCTPPNPTVYSLICLEEGDGTSQYYVKWTLDPVDGITQPCYDANNLIIKNSAGATIGYFNIVTHEIYNGVWDFEGTMTINAPYTFDDACWEIPMCFISNGLECGVVKVCNKREIDQYGQCEDHPCPDSFNWVMKVNCEGNPSTTATHKVDLYLNYTNVPPPPPGCNKYDIYITSTTGNLDPAGSIIVLNGVPAVNGNLNLSPANYPQLSFGWYNELATDVICLQVVIRYDDACFMPPGYPQNGRICTQRFCQDISDLNCDEDQGGYRFTAQCSRQQGDAGVLYDYVVEFLNETDIQKCDVKNINPNGFNTIVAIIGKNKVRGQYLSYKGDLNFSDIFVVNGRNQYEVSGTLPRCTEGGDKGDREKKITAIAPLDFANLSIMPNPASGQVLFSYTLPEENGVTAKTLMVVNSLGVIQQQFDLNEFGNVGVINYNVSALPNGVYQVYLFDEKRIISTERMVVIKN